MFSPSYSSGSLTDPSWPLTPSDTIAAIATAQGLGGVGVVRVSGSLVPAVVKAILKRDSLEPRKAVWVRFFDQEENVLDSGLAIYFKSPQSFTGEDVLELHGHGGVVILDCVLQAVIACGVRRARPGEFTERAFLNQKIDLVQAEAVADLIAAASEQAARAAVRSLEGAFSKEIHRLQELLIRVRMYVEAFLDFPDEEIEIDDAAFKPDLQLLAHKVDELIHTAKLGHRLQQGFTVVIAGKPNAGKSSLLNALAGRDSAIVTPIPGTTRDILREHILLPGGIPLEIIDTAGLHDSEDIIEQEGMRRAKAAIEIADHLLWVMDATAECAQGIPEEAKKLPTTYLVNKIDLVAGMPRLEQTDDLPRLYLSAKTQAGIDLLLQHLSAVLGVSSTDMPFSARARHLEALQRAKEHLDETQHGQSLECTAESLRLAQQAFSEILGEFTSDDLLGRIFSSFCIGK